MRTAFDSNILAYALIDERDTHKSEAARTLLVRESQRAECLISTQVLNEFCNLATRKFGVAEQVLTRELEQLCALTVITVDEHIIRAAVLRHFVSKISFYDALIVEAALHAKADILYSEDMQHGGRFGSMQVINPFA